MYAINMAQQTVASISIKTEAPKTGPGFDGLDADGDGGVTYEEFWAAAQAVRDGGRMTVTSSVARTSIQAVGVETGEASAADRRGGLTESLRRANVGFDAAAEFERAMAAIDAAAGGGRTEDAEAAPAEEATAQTATADELSAEEASLRAEAIEAVTIKSMTGLSSLDPYERAAENMFNLADTDGSGGISRSEYDTMKRVLFGGDRTAGESSLTLTASEGYAASQSISGSTLSAYRSLSISTR
ncbi:MAG: hypothetical protein MRY74_16085 [Neomegalonema sp.]|nr:hypothetical protein [Neomegalonema sp.]